MIFVFILVVYASGLWRMSVPLTGDQKTYLSIALEMKEKSSFIIPYLFDRANFLKPPFQYWMTLLGWQIFGFSLFGALIPSVIALVLAAKLTQQLSPEFRSPLPAVLFASTIATMTYGTTAQMEIWIVLFYLASWLLYLQKRLALAFLTVGVMAWIKGPLYPALFVFSIFLKAIMDGQAKLLMRPRFIACLLLGVFTGLAWYVAAARTEFEALRDVFFGRENFGKVSTSQGNGFSLWLEFLTTLFPISFLFVASLFDRNFKARFRANKTFWIGYAAIPAVFFTFFPYHVNTYLFLLTPLVVWMTIERPSAPAAVRNTIKVLAVMIAIVLIALCYRLASGLWISTGLAIALALVTFGWAIGNYRLEGKWIAISSLLLVNLIRIGATEIGEWDLQPLREVNPVSVAYFIEPNQQDIWHEYGLVSTAMKKPFKRVQNAEEARLFLEQGGTLVLNDEQVEPALAHCTPWRRLKRRMKFPLKELFLNGLSIEDPMLQRMYHLCQKS